MNGPPQDRAIFQDEQGRGWLVEIEYGHPAPAELGIFGARFTCPEAPEEPVRIGFVEMNWLHTGNESELRAALANAEPARAIG